MARILFNGFNDMDMKAEEYLKSKGYNSEGHWNKNTKTYDKDTFELMNDFAEFKTKELKVIIKDQTNKLELADELIESLKEEKHKIASAFAKYYVSEGCSCCRDYEPHEEALNELGKLLGVKRYDDDSGYDFFSLTDNK